MLPACVSLCTNLDPTSDMSTNDAWAMFQSRHDKCAVGDVPQQQMSEKFALYVFPQ